MRATIVYAVVGIAIAAGLAAQPQPVDTTVREARQLIDDGRAAEALAMLDAADVSRAGTPSRARIDFYRARAYEELGDPEKAVAAYAHATEIEPTYGAALNNLGQLLVRRGEAARAAGLLNKAAALDDPRRLLYLNNYAAAAEKAGNIEAARNAYAQVAAAQPDNVDAQLIAIRLLDDPRRMADLLLKLSKHGEAGAAQSLALDLLGKPFDAGGKRALLGVVAATLASQHIDPRRFNDLPVASRIAALRNDPLIGAGAGEVLLLYRGNADPAQYRWWRSPRDEFFAALIRDVGASRAASGEKQQAEACFKLALDYSAGTDPDAFVELAGLYFVQKRVAELDALAREYEAPLFAAKAATIAARDYAAEYRFHIALGTMYAYMQRWGSDDEPASAIFQLTQAQRAAADYNRALTWGTKIPTDPKSIELLATAYASVNRPERAIALRIEAAEAYVAEGRKTAANALLKPLKTKPSTIADPAYRKRYADVMEKLSQIIKIDSEVAFPDAIDVKLASVEPTASAMPRPLANQIVSVLVTYVFADTDAGRDRAEQTLRKLGVSDLEPATMSRMTGELVMQIEGKAVRYRYAIKGGQ